jgi:hypothetical protein
MKLKNKKTGEIIDDGYVRETYDFQFDGQKHVLAVFKGNGHRPPERVSGAYNSLAELNEEWEDAPEEPKEWWYIDIHGPHEVTNNDEYYQQIKAASKEFGNYFETKEEAEKAVEKLKAWKRLKDKGFRFIGLGKDRYGTEDIKYDIELPTDIKELGIIEDLNTCFGGEE